MADFGNTMAAEPHKKRDGAPAPHTAPGPGARAGRAAMRVLVLPRPSRGPRRASAAELSRNGLLSRNSVARAGTAGRAELEETKPVWADFYKVGRRAPPSFQRWRREHGLRCIAATPRLRHLNSPWRVAATPWLRHLDSPWSVTGTCLRASPSFQR